MHRWIENLNACSQFSCVFFFPTCVFQTRGRDFYAFLGIMMWKITQKRALGRTLWIKDSFCKTCVKGPYIEIFINLWIEQHVLCPDQRIFDSRGFFLAVQQVRTTKYLEQKLKYKTKKRQSKFYTRNLSHNEILQWILLSL